MAKWELPCAIWPSGFLFANPRIAGVLTDIGTEELAHLEMIGAIVRQLTRGLSAKNWKLPDLHHIILITPQVSGRRLRVEFHFPATEFQSSGDAIADLVEDMAAEQKSKKNV